MSLFKSKPRPQQAFLKMGVYGNAGSGKTYTSSQVAAGLAVYLREKTGKTPPVAFLDTETGSAWVDHIFKQHDIEFFSYATRSFQDLKNAVKEAEEMGAILIVDSITHFWQELTLSFAKQRRRRDNKLEFQDYGVIKPLWNEFTQSFLNSQAHIILCGRAGNTYDYQEKDDGSGKKELISTGTKMKAESEMGYEPSLLVEMVAEKSPDRKKKLTVRKGYIIKDRSTLLDGREFINPSFRTFMPHIERLKIGGEHIGVDQSRSSAELFEENTGRPEWQKIKQQKEIVIEEIQNLLNTHHGGQTQAAKQEKIQLVRQYLAPTWKEVEEVLKLDQLRDGFDRMHLQLEGVPSRYSSSNLDEFTSDETFPDGDIPLDDNEEREPGREG